MGRVGTPAPRRLLAAVCVLSIAGAGSACKRPLGELADLPVAPEPVDRLPYLTGVMPESSATAHVVWRAAVGARDSFAYRVGGDSAWRSAEIERGEVHAPGVRSDSVQDRRVRLTGLPSGGTVEYRVWIDSLDTGTIPFETPPEPGTETELSVLAFADSGWGSPSQLRLAEVIQGRDWDLAVHMGDLAYTNGTRSDFTLRHFSVYPRLLATVPFYPTPGDHDLRTGGGEPYDEAFVWPAPVEGARYYGFRWGRVQFIGLDTPDGARAGQVLRRGTGAQLEWLRETLEASAGDPAVGWTIVFMHNPIYSHAVGIGGHGHDPDLQRVIGPLFDRYGVDLVLSGHDHHYERTVPIRDGEPVPPGCGPVYIVSGGGGASRVARGLGRSYLTAVAVRAHQVLSLQISAEQIIGESVGEDGSTIDRFSVVPSPGGRASDARCR